MWGSAKNVKAGEIYRSTNAKWIQIEGLTDSDVAYVIIKCDRRKGRANDIKVGAHRVFKRSNMSNFYGPIEIKIDFVNDFWQ